MYPLFIFATLTLGLLLERLYFFRRIKVSVSLWVDDFSRSHAGPEISTEPDFASLKDHPLGKIFSSLWKERFLPRSDLESLAQGEAEAQLQSYERNLKPLGVIAMISPLLGLLGTLWGIMKAFQQTAGGTQVDPTLLASGIWEALITTFVGLAIAIPAWLAYYYFESRLNRLAFIMEYFSNRFIRRIQYPSPGLDSIDTRPGAAKPA